MVFATPFSADINALLTDCEVHLTDDGSPTEETQLQRWLRFAPPPKRLRICYSEDAPGCNLHRLVAFLGSCMQQELAMRLLQHVDNLELQFLVCSLPRLGREVALKPGIDQYDTIVD